MHEDIIKDAAQKQKDRGTDYPAIQDTYDMLLDLSRTARTNGLLALIEKTSDIIQKKTGENESCFHDEVFSRLTKTERLLTALVQLLTDGTDSNTFADIAFSRYFAANFEGTDALVACMIIFALSGIQEGEAPYMIRTRLLALMPEAIEKQVLKEDARRNG